MNAVATISGFYSFADGFVPNTHGSDLEQEHALMIARASQNLEAEFDRLMKAGKRAEAAWLVEHIEEVQTQTG